VFDTACPPKPNGNTRHAPPQTLLITEKSTKSPGTTATPKMKHTLSVRRSRTPGVCTIWKATSKSGSRTIIRPTTTPTVLPLTRPVPREDAAGEGAEDSVDLLQTVLEASVDAAAEDSAGRRQTLHPMLHLPQPTDLAVSEAGAVARVAPVDPEAAAQVDLAVACQ